MPLLFASRRSIVRALLALSLAGICALFGMLLSPHHTSTRLPSDPFVYRLFNLPSIRCSLPVINIVRVLHIVAGGNSRPVQGASFVPSHFCLLLHAFPQIHLFTDCSTST
jgi:hypothetical protein